MRINTHLSVLGIKMIWIFTMYYGSYMRCRKCFTFFFSENKILNQKYFYVEKKNYISLKTRDQIEISMSERQLYNIDFYFYTKDMNIDFLRKFFGHLVIVKFEGYNKDKNIYKQGMFFYFYNSVKKKYLFLILHDKKDIYMILVILEKYLEVFELELDFNFKERELIISSFYDTFEKEFEDFDLFYKFEPILGYKKLISYLVVLRELYLNRFSKQFYDPEYYKELYVFGDKFKKENYKCFIYVKTKNDLNKAKAERDFKKIDLQDWYNNEKDFFLNFNGQVYLIDHDIIIDNSLKVKRVFVLFCDIAKGQSYLFEMYDMKNFDIVLYLIQNFFIDDINSINRYDTNCDGFLNAFIPNIIDKNMCNTFFDKNNSENLLLDLDGDILELNFKEIKIDRQNIKLLWIQDLNELYYNIMYLKYASTV